MRITLDRLVQLRWLLLGAVSAGACGGTVHTTPDGGGGTAGGAVGGTGSNHMGGSAGVAGKATMGGTTSVAGSAATAGSGGVAGRPAGGESGSGGATTTLTHGECTDPQPAHGGFVTCGDGTIHRVAKVECPNTLPEAPVTCGVEPDMYVCDGTKREFCDVGGFGTAPPTSCAVGCATDADCAADQICVCGAQTGTCMAATCALDADCGDGFFCREVQTEHGIGCGAVLSFQCQLESDACASPADCGTGGGGTERCQPALPGGPLRCEPESGPACGRPFLINGAPRSACLVAESDWAAAFEPDATALDAATRAALADGWNQLGIMEHASVAAFARFTLQLLGFGAPHALIAESNRAIADETRHAELCFGLAASFGSTTAGPGPLDSQGALERRTLRDVVLDTFLEGCIGETVAALEATEALAHVQLASVRPVLEQIAQDEARHAALAWRFVVWGVAQQPELVADLQQRLELELQRAVRAHGMQVKDATPECDALAAAGLLSESSRAELRLHALREVVAPCLAAVRRETSSTKRACSSRPAGRVVAPRG